MEHKPGEGKDRETEILECLHSAMEKAGDCDDIVIIMQYKEGKGEGAAQWWTGPDSSTVAMAHWLASCLASWLCNPTPSPKVED